MAHRRPVVARPPPPLSLEDQVFGVDDRDVHAFGPDGQPRREAPPAVGTTTATAGVVSVGRSDGVTRFMLPIVVCLVLVVVVLWSLTKSVQYTELFTTNARYQYGLWSLNVSVIVLGLTVLCCAQQRPSAC